MAAAGSAVFVALWAASVVWTARDAARRCADRTLRFGVVAGAIVLPLVGAAVYALTRPCEDRAERRAQRLRIAFLEASVAGPEPAERCTACSEPLEPDFRCCPRCGEEAHVRCGGCDTFVRPTWTACPWCAKPLSVESEPHTRRHAA